jgi:hypothetical protein
MLKANVASGKPPWFGQNTAAFIGFNVVNQALTSVGLPGQLQ